VNPGDDRSGRRVALAAVAGAHGVKGEVRLKLFSDSVESLSRHDKLYVGGAERRLLSVRAGGKAAGGMGTLVGGLALDWLHFPREVGRQVHAVVQEPVLAGLVIAWGVVPAMLLLVGAAVFWPYRISRERQTEIAAALALKRAADVSEGRSS